MRSLGEEKGAKPRRLLLALLLLAACAPPAAAPDLPAPAHLTAVWTQTPEPAPTAPAASSMPASPTPSGWIEAGPGIERREFAVPIEGATLAETLILFRLDPPQVTFRVHYTPGRDQFISDWARALQDDRAAPLLVLNAGFFTEDYRAAAFTVADGRADGASYVGFGGMFAVQNGAPRVRSLTVEPWQREERFEQAVQGTPVLVRPGRTPYTTADGQRSRRTAIGQASTGEIVVIVAPHYRLTLAELAQALLAPELDLAIALNLDGGSSTGYWAGRDDRLDSDKSIPAVIAVYPK